MVTKQDISGIVNSIADYARREGVEFGGKEDKNAMPVCFQTLLDLPSGHKAVITLRGAYNPLQSLEVSFIKPNFTLEGRLSLNNATVGVGGEVREFHSGELEYLHLVGKNSRGEAYRERVDNPDAFYALMA